MSVWTRICYIRQT